MAAREQLSNDPQTALEIALSGWQSSLWTAIPCIVESVNLTENTIVAQPCIQGVVTNEDGSTTLVNMPLLPDVPIVFPNAGGFMLTLPIKAGDEVLVIIASRCIDSWWQSSGIGVPMEARMHDLSDAFAIPGPRSKPKVVTGISATGAQLRNEAGTTYIEISADGKIKIVSPVEIDLTGNLIVSGNITATQVTAGGIALTTHKHVGVTTGAGTSGGPVP